VVEGQHIFVTDAGLVLCAKCWDTAAPRCGACSKPATGPIARFAGRVYHADCFKCESCCQRIQGPCALGPAGLFCAPCKESITAQMHEIKDCLSTGNAVRAAEIAQGLFKRHRIKIPGMPELKCVMCSAQIDGTCDQTPNGFVCPGCATNAAARMSVVSTQAQNPEPREVSGSSCRTCGAHFAIGEPLYGPTEDGQYTCRACGEASFSWRPNDCSACGEPFAPGQPVLKSDSDPEKSLCERCFQKQVPLCGACGKPLGKSVASLGGKQYHSGCMYCSICSQLIVTEYAESANGLVCGQCLITNPVDATLLIRGPC